MNSYKLLPALTVLLCFCGCQPGQKSHGTETSTIAPETENELRFNPLDLPVDKEVIPAKYPLDIGMKQTPLISVADSGDMHNAGQREIILPEEHIDSLNNQTFRIQLLTAKVYGEARHAAIVAEEIFDRPVHLDYEVPYFKVRVGKFYNRDDAEIYLQKVKAAGYRNAWVVMTVVKPKQVAPMYIDDGYQYIEDSLGLFESNESSDE